MPYNKPQTFNALTPGPENIRGFFSFLLHIKPAIRLYVQDKM